MPGRGNLVSRIIPGVTGNHEETARLAQGGFVGTEGQEPGVHVEVMPGAKSLGCQVRCLDVI